MSAAGKCRLCEPCAGLVCRGELPGMGGVNQSENFILNCGAWREIPPGRKDSGRIPQVRLAPMTGAVENAGWHDERSFYPALVGLALRSGFALSIGDGTPDEKLLYGIQAVRDARMTNPGVKAAVFIKPYENKKILERMEMAMDVAEVLGVDTDAFNIVTMRDKARLERKSSAQLKELMDWSRARGIPFAVKGIFTEYDMDILRDLCPDIAVVSNHGGRVPVRRGSTAAFLALRSDEILLRCGALWADGGIRSLSDVRKAAGYGVSCVMLGRPFVSTLLSGKDSLVLKD